MAELNNSSTGQWYEVDASNVSASPDGWPTGTYPNQVEPIGRSTMGAIKRFWDRINGTVTTTGSANAYVYTPVSSTYPTAYVSGEVYTFKANFTNTGAATINIRSLGAKNIFQKSGAGVVALTGGEIRSGDIVIICYDGTQFQIISSSAGSSLRVSSQVFTANGTYTPTTGMVYCIVEMVGGGGGGGGCPSTSAAQCACAGGGGSGAYAKSLLSATDIGVSKAVVVGGGGGGGGAGAYTGASGGDTSLGALMAANGGVGGTAGNAINYSSGTLGGTGGSASTGNIVAFNGQDGGCGITAVGGGGYMALGGSGSGTPLGTGGVGAFKMGADGIGYGSGGAGAGALASSAALAGGNGAGGCVLITEFVKS